ncbi:MAG TPA: SpoIIE family protein phosphatase, partial [Leptospiraceae bacterium]|nr:SpoIIE family protein phosphatase [Leptospiraceae bacterium]
HDVEDHIIQSLYFGILFSMIAYNLLIYIFLRDKSYLYYVLFVISSGVGIAAFNGIAGEWLWGDNPYIEKIGVNAWSVIACTTLMFFMRRMLNSKIDTPILDKFNWLTMFIQWTALFLMLWDFKGFVKLVIFSQIFIAGWITFYSIIRSFQKNRASYFFVTAFTFLMIAISSGYLRVLGILPINKFTTEGVQISSAIQMILLAIALADRYNTLRKEKERAEALIQENLKKSNLELEEKVKERTHELNKSLHLIKEDLNLAKKIQMNALSMNPTDIKDLKLAIKYLPMTEVGGDFFDISKIDDRTYRIFIADATGHGVQAAMITMVIKGIYDNIKSFGLKPNEILEIFNNEFIHKYISLNSYLTAIVVDIDTESKTLTYVSAGHPSSILLSRGEIKELTRTGKIIGVFKGTNYQSITINFSEKDKLFLFTDGIFEEFNKSEEEFGEERLQEIIRKNHDKSISEIIDISLDELNSFLGAKEKQDDITIIGIELN